MSHTASGMKTLLLWDIDGTLIRSGGAGARALDAALRAEFEIDGTTTGIEFAGRTDRWIARKIFERFQIEPHDKHFNRLFERYYALLPHELARSAGVVLPGVREILEAATFELGFSHGLLTGNLRRGAEIKLQHYELWQHFPFGAFGDDSEHRNELGPHALRRAREHARFEFPPDRVWVIGDTPHDIACGRIIGARTLAIAAGSYSSAELAAYKPDILLSEFADTTRFLEAVATQPA